MRAPSSLNTQPWNFYVVAGDVLDRIREENTRLMLSGAPVQRDVVVSERYEGWSGFKNFLWDAASL